jgi:2'-5' RNA ligase
MFRFQLIVNLSRIVRHHQLRRQRWSTQIMMSISTSRARPTSARPVTYRYTNSKNGQRKVLFSFTRYISMSTIPVLFKKSIFLAPRRISRAMSYAAAAGGSSGPPRQPQNQHPNANGQTKPASPNGNSGRQGRPQRQPTASPERRGQGYQKTEHVTREEHKPQTENAEEQVYVLTLKLTDSLSVPMNRMREQYFPKKLNRIPAHLTLFHALPHSQHSSIEAGLSQLAANTKQFLVTTGKPFRMRLGVGVNVGKGYNGMKALHDNLKSHWMPHLSEQDRGGWRPHWTVMNKVNEEKKVEDAFQAIQDDVLENVREGKAVGLVLWRYDKGNWKWASEYNFVEQ